MKKLIAVCAVLFLAIGTAAQLSAQTPAAENVTGTWSGQVSTPNGDLQITVHFKQDGDKLTGTSDPPMGGDPSPLENCKIDGNKVYWEISFNGMTIQHEGTVNGDEMKVTAKSAGEGGFPPMEMTLKRAQQ
jgi:hypothetical protein